MALVARAIVGSCRSVPETPAMRPISSMIVSLAATLLAAFACGGQERDGGYVPDEGFVPTKEVAIKIAVAVWEPIYGVDHIAREKPYRAKLEDGVWIVEGSLPPAKKGESRKGGVAIARISKKDGCIVHVSHGK